MSSAFSSAASLQARMTALGDLPDDCLTLVARCCGEDGHRLAQVSARFRALVTQFAAARLRDFPVFQASMACPLRDVFRLEEHRLRYRSCSVACINHFELFHVAGNDTHSFCFPSTFQCMLVMDTLQVFDMVILFDAPPYSSVNDSVCNAEYIVLVDMFLNLHVLSLPARSWRRLQLPAQRVNYVQAFFDGEHALQVVVWGLDRRASYYHVDLRALSHTCETAEAPAAAIMMHSANCVVGFGEDPDLRIPKRTELLWVKERVDGQWRDVPFAPRTCSGYLQFAKIGDYLLFFFDRCKSMACLHQGAWRPDVPLPVLAHPWWTSWHTTKKGLVSWDVWSNRIVVHSYSFF